MEWNLLEFENLIGIQLLGQVSHMTIGQPPKQKQFTTYKLNLESLSFIRKKFGSSNVRIILPNTFELKPVNYDRLNIVIDKNFVIKEIKIG